MSIHPIRDSSMAKEYLKGRNLEMPLSDTTIWKLIYGFYLEKKKEMIVSFKSYKKNGYKFSITTDEWTDLGR